LVEIVFGRLRDAQLLGEGWWHARLG
jgi:hypothetical protein